jgi:formylglycine-generating enzyme required for sulfatase activity
MRARRLMVPFLAGLALACVSLAAVEGEPVSIPGGEFVGSDGHVYAVAPYRLDRTEVTVRMYRQCEKAGHCRGTIGDRMLGCDDACEAENRRVCNYARPGRGNYPMDCVSASQAATYCAWRGGRLPTNLEWQWEARGGEEARVYPWGDTPPSCDVAVILDRERGDGCGRGFSAPVGTRETGASRHGTLDLSGNVSEWVTTSEDGRMITTIGGSAHSMWWEYAADRGHREGTPIEIPIKQFSIGFRCAYDG